MGPPFETGLKQHCPVSLTVLASLLSSYANILALIAYWMGFSKALGYRPASWATQLTLCC